MRLRARSPRLGDKEHREREERTFDRCLVLLKSNPGKLDLVATAVSEEAKQRPTELMVVTQQLLSEWHEAGLPQARRQRGQGAASVAFRRKPLRDLLREHAARIDSSTDEAAAHLRREIRRAATQSGLQASTSLAFSQVFVARFVEALHRPKGGGPGLHDVAIQMCLDLAADLKRDLNMGREERYKWVKRVLDLQERVASIVKELAQAEAVVAGQDRADLIGVRTGQESAVDPSAQFSDLTLSGLRDHAQGLLDALGPIADIERGLAPDLAIKPPA